MTRRKQPSHRGPRVARYREGTLTGAKITGLVFASLQDEARAFPRSLHGMVDFLEKSARLADDLAQSGPVRAERARSLKLDVSFLRRCLERGLADLTKIDANVGGRALEDALYRAVCAGLGYANLANELRDDSPSKGRRKRTTRTAYFAAKKRLGVGATYAELARELDITEQALRNWRRRNLR